MTTISGPRIALGDRILDSFPLGTYCPTALLRILDIVETRETPSAAIECGPVSRLLVNPEFVREHAQTLEKLLVLILHELHHLILGHTRLYPRATLIDNLVFDAVINAMLCRLLPEPEHRSFFTDLYDDGQFPDCFLRPVPGWTPDSNSPPVPRALRRSRWRRLAEVHQALYSPAGCSYSELRDALGAVRSRDGAPDPVLLGDHRPEGENASSSGGLERRAPVLLEEVRRIVERWPRPPDPVTGRSLHDALERTRVHVPPPGNRERLFRLLRRLADSGYGHAARRRVPEPAAIATPIPGRGRRTAVMRALGAAPLLHPGTLSLRRRCPVGERVHVYLDVSGSIGDLVGPLYAAVLRCREAVHPAIHLFSTRICDVSFADLRRGVVKGTGGTSIECVADHIERHRVRRAVVITDGYVGRPGGRHREILLRTRLGVALTPTYGTRHDLEPVADCFVQLIDKEETP